MAPQLLRIPQAVWLALLVRCPLEVRLLVLELRFPPSRTTRFFPAVPSGAATRSCVSVLSSVTTLGALEPRCSPTSACSLTDCGALSASARFAQLARHSRRCWLAQVSRCSPDGRLDSLRVLGALLRGRLAGASIKTYGSLLVDGWAALDHYGALWNLVLARSRFSVPSRAMTRSRTTVLSDRVAASKIRS